MKRTLSLIITAALLLACFTQVTFADIEREEIAAVEITGVRTEPVVGDRAVEYMQYKLPAGANYVVQDIMWYDTDADVRLDYQAVFAKDTHYQLMILIFPKTGYIFTENTEFILNGGEEYSPDSFMEKDGFGFWFKTIPTLAVKNTVLGDANEDGQINTSDAAAILRHAAGMAVFSGDSFTAADVNRDNAVNTADAVLVLRYAAGMIHSFDEIPVEQPEPDYTLSFHSLDEYREFYAAGELSDTEFTAFMQSHDYYMNGITSKDKHKAVCNEINAAPLPTADGLKLTNIVFHTGWHQLLVGYDGANGDRYSYLINTDSDEKLAEYLTEIRNNASAEKVQVQNENISEAYYLVVNDYGFEAYCVVMDDYYILYRASGCTADEARNILEQTEVSTFI